MNAGTTQLLHEHCAPDHANEPSLARQCGHCSFPSLSANAPMANTSGSTKYDEHALGLTLDAFLPANVTAAAVLGACVISAVEENSRRRHR